jgi:hypothetical protein
METVSYSQVQDLISRLPITKLPLVYNWLLDLTAKETEQPSPQIDFMRLPLSERRQIMTQQATLMAAHYKQMIGEREIWQGGDCVDEYQTRCVNQINKLE